MRQMLIPLIPLFFAFIFNEYFIYHFVIGRCSWPKMATKNRENEFTKVMILADPHLLGVKNGHWFDKLRREWQMHRSFQTAISWLSPDAVFFLGDLFDEGQWASDQQFDIYANRFDQVFYVPETTQRYVAIGNHDVGFHYALMPHHLDRFSRRFNIDPTVGYVNIGGNHFIIVNSMAMEKDGCKLCHQAEETIKTLKEKFDCALSGDCEEEKLVGGYSRPILLQHFPLFRENDEVCEFETDLAPPSLRSEPFREKWECISQESTDFLVKSLRPRAAFGGHSHFTCSKFWEAPYNFWEYTIASFSWRNNRWPSFLLLKVSPNELKVKKCHLPHEHTVIWIYAFSTLLSISIAFIQFFLWSRSRSFSFRRVSTKIS